MAVTAQQLIEASYARSTANDAGRLATDLELVGQLNRTFQGVYAVWAAASADDSLSNQLFTFTGIPPAITLPTDVVDLDRLELGGIGGDKVNLIPVSEKERGWHLAPAVYRQGLSLVSRGFTGDPVAGTVVSIYLADAPATLSALSSVIDARFPVRFHNLLVLDLALYLDAKDEGRDMGQHQKLKDAYADAMQVFQTATDTSDSAKDKSVNPRGKT